MSANASSHKFSDGTPMKKCIDHDDDSVIKTENSCLDAMSCDDGISAELSGIPFDQSAAVVPKPTDDDIRPPTSQGQTISDNLSSADQQFGKMGNSGNSFECQQCNSQLGTFEQFIKHMKTAHLQHCDGIVSDSASAKCQCQICGRQLAINQREFNTHLAEHLLDTRTKWHCLRCHGKHFDDANELRQHLVQCHVHTVFRCAICLEIFAEKDVMEDHLMARHCAKQQKFLCAACEISFDSHFAFELHLGQVHAALGDDQSRNRQSKSTNGTSSSKGKEDKKEQQPNRNSETMTNGTVPKSARSVQFATSTHTTQKGLKCVVCDLQCLDEFALDQHRLFEHCKVPFGNRCGVCRCPLDSIGTFVDHSLAHRNPTNEEVHCVVCRQLIRGDVQLKMHGQYHLEGTKEGEYGKKRREKDNEEGESGGEGHHCETGDVLLDKDGAGVGDEPPTRDSPLSLSPISALSFSAADNDHNGISSSVPFTMPTMKCPCCQMNLTAEDYGKHLLFHVMVGSLTDFGGAIFGDNGTGGIECAPKEGKMPMGCARCGRIFDTFAALNSHMLEHLRENIDGGMPKSPTTASKNRSRGRSDTLPTCCPTGQSIECEKCGQKFTSVGRFIAHWRRHKMERTMEKCRICDRRFASKVQLDDHHSAEHSAKLQQMSGK